MTYVPSFAGFQNTNAVVKHKKASAQAPAKQAYQKAMQKACNKRRAHLKKNHKIDANHCKCKKHDSNWSCVCLNSLMVKHVVTLALGGSFHPSLIHCSA